MSKNVKDQKADKNIIAVEKALSRSEQFIEKNQKLILIAVGVILLIVALFIGFTRFYLPAREKSARAEMFMAENYFEKDSLSLALKGDGLHLGFLDIISDFKYTKSANLARYYAGITHLHLGQYEDAIKHLVKFKKRDQMLGAMAYGAIGDAYVELENISKGLEYYEKAYKFKPNEFTTPIFLFKAGMLNEINGNLKKALELYQKIKDDYENSNEGRNIDRYIARVSARL